MEQSTTIQSISESHAESKQGGKPKSGPRREGGGLKAEARKTMKKVNMELYGDETMKDFVFPKKKEYIKKNPVPLATNFFKFKFIEAEAYFKYVIEYEPELPGDSYRMRRRVLYSAKDQLKKMFGNFIFNNNTLYAKQNMPGETLIETQLKEEKYTIRIKWVSLMETNSTESFGLLKRFFFQLVKKLNFVQMRKNYYSSANVRSVEAYKFDIWTGFKPTVNKLNEGILINLNIVHRVLRSETALDFISSIQRKCNNGDQARELILEAFRGTVVLTKYNNNKTFIIEGVDFDTNPTKTFLSKGQDITYIEYYKKKYGIDVMPDQMLLINKDKNGKLIHIIPQHAYMTGMTEEMRNNFMLMSEMARFTKGTAAQRVNESLSLVDAIMSNEECKKEIDTWGIRIDKNLVTLEGSRVLAGDIIMGRGVRINAEANQDFDRKMQGEMLSQPGFDHWAIFYNERDDNLIEKFINTFIEVRKTFNYSCSEPKRCPVRGNQARDWKQQILNNTSPQTNLVVCMLPGSKGKGPLYKDVKKYLISDIPIPSQCVLTGTLSRDKGFRSVINKLLIQMCAKVGGEPWTIDNLPFTNQPTMVCSYEIYGGKTLNQPIMSFCATYNRNFTKYVSYVKRDNPKDIENQLKECIKNAVQNFKNINKDILPSHIIVFRDSACLSHIKMKLLENIKCIKQGVKEVDPNQNVKITYVALCKKSNVKMFYYNGNKQDSYINCPPGTVIDENVVNDELSDFYMISQRTTQGIAQPVHYYVAFDDFGVDRHDLYTLIFKLSYLYFNWTGSVKIPGPCQYAKKLSQMMGEKLSDRREAAPPNIRFENQLKTLYFL